MKNKLQLTSLLTILFFTSIIYVQAQTWTQKANFPGAARAYDVGFSIGHYGFIGCGNNGTSYYKDFYRWNQDSNTWTAIANYPGLGYEYLPVAFSIEGSGYAGLGWTGSAGATDLWRYDTTTKTWAQMASFPGAGRYDLSAFVIGHKAYIIGGSTGGAPYLDDIWMYDAHQNTWKQMNNCPAGKIEGMAAFSIGNHGYIGGGWNNTNYLNTFWEYDTTNDSWTSIANIPLSGGLGGLNAVFVIGHRAYICTGYTNNGTNLSKLSDGYVYDTTTKTWALFTNMGTNGIERSFSAVFSIGNYGYIGTGVDSLSGVLKDFWQYGPNTTTNIEEVKSSRNINIKLYPNPSNGDMNLTYNGNLQQGEFKIIDLMGRIIDSYEIIGSKGQMTINETALSNGMYFYQILDSGTLISSGKFILTK